MRVKIRQAGQFFKGEIMTEQSVMAEVMTLVRDYCRYWDEWDDGFELPEMSTAARIVWNHIKRDLAESNKRYFLNKGKQKR